MGGSQKSKRVTWPSDDNLCQVRLFLSEDSPAQVGFGSQDHLQAKTWPSHSNFTDDNLPPGFEGTQPAPWNKLPQIPLIRWQCPIRFKLDETWRVAAGEESIEFERENERVKRVLEAIYPRESAIPSDPSDAVGGEDSFANDRPPILIPITPIEDDDAPAAADGFVDSAMMNPPPMNLQAQTAASLASSSNYALTTNSPAQGGVPAAEVIPGVDPAVVSAANAALSAVMANNSQGNLIDRDLLIKILSDPKMVEQLVKNHVASSSPQVLPATSAQNVPTTVSAQPMGLNSSHSLPDAKAYSMASSTTPNMPATSMQNRLRPMTQGISFSDPSTIPVGGRTAAHVNRAEFVAAPLTTTSGGVFYPPPAGRIAPGPNPRSQAPEVIPSASQTITKDINYYKSLIQQHGGDRQETVQPQYGSRSNHHLLPVREPSNNGRSRDMKPKIMKPCIYYNTPRGCRNGANCAYQHDESGQQRVSSLPESQSAKRMKMDREITGT